jgi:hypothetical protein
MAHPAKRKVLLSLSSKINKNKESKNEGTSGCTPLANPILDIQFGMFSKFPND